MARFLLQICGVVYFLKFTEVFTLLLFAFELFYLVPFYDFTIFTFFVRALGMYNLSRYARVF